MLKGRGLHRVHVPQGWESLGPLRTLPTKSPLSSNNRNIQTENINVWLQAPSPLVFSAAIQSHKSCITDPFWQCHLSPCESPEMGSCGGVEGSGTLSQDFPTAFHGMLNPTGDGHLLQ